MSKIGENRENFVKRLSEISPVQKYEKPKQQLKKEKETPEKGRSTFAEMLIQKAKEGNIEK